MIGCVGPHRAGKTTIAKDLADRMGLYYFDASFGKMASELGYDAVGNMSLATRLEMQTAVLDVYTKAARNAIFSQKKEVIADRTPMDMIGYMLGDTNMTSFDALTDDGIVTYVNACLRATEDLFDRIIVLEPIPGYDAAPGKPLPSKGYQKAIQYIISGALFDLKDDEDRSIIWIKTTDHEARMRQICNGLDLVKADG